MSFLSVIPKLLGIPKQLKKEHVLEMDFKTGTELFKMAMKSYDQNQTIMFLQKLVRELSELKKYKELDITDDIKQKIPLLLEVFTHENRFYLENNHEKGKFISEVHLINLYVINDKKTVEFKNIEENLGKLGVEKLKNAAKRYLNFSANS